MYITLESDYAIRIITFLLRQKERNDAKTISENTDVTLRFSLKILRKLVSGGIVRSYKGASGGYEIATEEKEISLADVITLIEGEFCLSRCLKSEAACTHGESCDCKVNHVFRELSDYVMDRLSKTTFDQLI